MRVRHARTPREGHAWSRSRPTSASSARGTPGSPPPAACAQAGQQVVVLEARDRVGGRVWTRPQRRRHAARHGRHVPRSAPGPGCSALADEMGVDLYPTNVVGDSLLATGGKLRRYEADKTPAHQPGRPGQLRPGDAPPRPHGQEGAGRRALGRAARPTQWDATTAAAWLSRAERPHPRGPRPARGDAPRPVLRRPRPRCRCSTCCSSSAPAAGCSASCRSRAATSTSRSHGGAQTIAQRVADELGDSVAPRARRCARHAARRPRRRSTGRDGRRSRPATSSWPSRRRWPATSATTRRCPADKALLLHQMPAAPRSRRWPSTTSRSGGDDGLCGASVAIDDPFEVTLDTSPAAGDVGVIALYAAGPKARALAATSPRPSGARSRSTSSPAASAPRRRTRSRCMEQNWAEQEWTRGLLDGPLRRRACSPSTAG